MTDYQHCRTCRYFSNNANDHQTVLPDGQCVRYPPQMVQMRPNELTQRWPQVQQTHWCGEWVANRNGGRA
jgi:hypothetical protein